MNMNDEKEKLKQIAKISDIIRQKYKLLKSQNFNDEQKINQILKPVITPLEGILNAKRAKSELKIKAKKEPKRERESELNDLFPDVDAGQNKNINGFYKTREFDNNSADDSQNSVHDSDDDNEDQNFFSFIEDDTGHIESGKSDLGIASDVNDVSMKSVSLNRESAVGDGDENRRLDNDALVKKYLTRVETKDSSIDVVMGVRKLQNGFHVGSSKFNSENGEIIIGENDRYDITKGLIELLFEKNPNKTIITSDDYETYKKILLKTNAHKTYYSNGGNLRTKEKKFNDVISPLLGLIKEGKGNVQIPSKMIYNTNNLDYIYWNSADELVDRLKLLIAEQVAGNNNSSINNEIISIIDELREENIIY